MKYFKRFQTQQQFENFLNSEDYLEPNVSYIDEVDHIIKGMPKPISPLKFTAVQANSTIKLTRVGTNASNLSNAVLEYSTDGVVWNSYTLNTNITLSNVGDYVMFKGNNVSLGYDSNNYHKFVMTGTIKASGDITSLNNGIGGDCILTNYCYEYMFLGCTALTTAPALPATTLAKYCYRCMFQNCTSLTSVPALPATTLADSCYYRMFYRCTSLATAPELPATTLVNSCYYQMFYNCTNLNYIKCLAIDVSANNCLYNWVYNVSINGTFVKNSSATWTTTGVSGIPNGWTVQTAAA